LNKKKEETKTSTVGKPPKLTTQEKNKAEKIIETADKNLNKLRQQN
jgi:hypothetical protein